ncbi:MAG: hypothetical protein ACE5G0_04035 [Rhodothermales bacterium]
MTTNTRVLPTREFDSGTITATPDVLTRMTAVLEEAKRFGLDLRALSHQAKTASRPEAEQVLAALHDAAAILFLQWKRARHRREVPDALALARLFNGLTRSARDLNQRHACIDTDHLQVLAVALKEDQNYADFDPARLARTLEVVAEERTHERSWPWVVLPTFARQPYGRILLLKVDVEEADSPIFVTQPFFLSGRSTLFHTHGRNWALARPLGNGEDKNVHVNTLWMPRRPEDPFPLVQVDCSEYSNEDVVVIPPRIIHGIARKRSRDEVLPSLPDMLGDSGLRADLVAHTRFGERACLHVYCPHLPLVKDLAESPILKADTRFFVEYDMIVFDHVAGTIWSGGGGCWPRRMVEFGPTGAHCGLCFEDDPRRENLDPRLVSEWLIERPPPQLITFKRE